MKLSDLLTILVPLKGRPEYTKRFLEYSEWVKCPFKILLGDGGNDDLNLSKKDFNIDFEYIKYPYDKDIPTYCYKLSSMVSKVTTPLTMMIDNDNFYCIDGILKVIDFLNNNRSYHGGRGCLTRCEVIGKKLSPEKRKIHYFPSVIGNSASERVINNINLFHTHLHDVINTKILKITHEIINIVSSSDLKIPIILNALCSTSFGNNYRDDSFTYFFHEDGTPRIEGTFLPLDKNWVLESYWNDSMARLTSAVGVCISYVDKINLIEAKKIFLNNFIQHLFNNEDNAHRVENKDVRKKIINSIDNIINLSNNINLDDKIFNCLSIDYSNNFILDDDFKFNEIHDDEFRNFLNSYLKNRKYCLNR